jgi:hypothetical protein
MKTGSFRRKGSAAAQFVEHRFAIVVGQQRPYRRQHHLLFFRQMYLKLVAKTCCNITQLLPGFQRRLWKGLQVATWTASYFPLKTADTVVEVQLGPKEFVQRSTFIFKPGDMLIIVGVPIVLKERRVVFARQVSGMNGTLILRDDDGVRYGTAIRSDMIR